MGQNALIVGSGGREHALAWKISQSKIIGKVFVAPGNGGTSDCNVAISSENIKDLIGFAKRNNCFTVVGPEIPLSIGIVDRFQREGLEIFGPTAEEAKLETSKSFAKQFMAANGIPTADFRIFNDSVKAIDYAHRFGGQVVVKADGLAAGKGVFVCGSLQEAELAIKKILDQRIFGDAGNCIVIEDKLEGNECSVMTICDGHSATFFGSARDHKRVFDSDKGPNTGGMGAYSPAGENESIDIIMKQIAEPVARASGFRGFLYFGLMLTNEGPKVLEFNVRLGDPEAQVILPRLNGDLIEILRRSLREGLSNEKVSWSPKSSCAVVMCSQGYPEKSRIGDPIFGLGRITEEDDVKVFHSGTKKEGSRFLTNAGRVLSVVGLGGNLQAATQMAYSAVNKISWHGEHHRSDIGRICR